MVVGLPLRKASSFRVVLHVAKPFTVNGEVSYLGCGIEKGKFHGLSFLCRGGVWD